MYKEHGRGPPVVFDMIYFCIHGLIKSLIIFAMREAGRLSPCKLILP